MLHIHFLPTLVFKISPICRYLTSKIHIHTFTVLHGTCHHSSITSIILHHFKALTCFCHSTLRSKAISNSFSIKPRDFSISIILQPVCDSNNSIISHGNEAIHKAYMFTPYFCAIFYLCLIYQSCLSCSCFPLHVPVPLTVDFLFFFSSDSLNTMKYASHQSKHSSLSINCLSLFIIWLPLMSVSFSNTPYLTLKF